MEDLELIGSRPPSVASQRPPSVHETTRPRSGYKVVSDISNLDEEFPLPYQNKRTEPVIHFKPSITPRRRNDVDKLFKKSKLRPLHWAPEERSASTSHSERVDEQHVSRSLNKSINFNRYRPVKQKPSFCDETLFGPRLEEPTFDAPWAQKTKKAKPLLFSPVDYAKLMREGSTLSAKYSSSGTLDGRPPSRQGRRPVTASTRPVTVECATDVDKKIWKP